MKQVALIATVAMALCSCASSPDSLKSPYVSPLKYSSNSCDELTTELTTVSERINVLHASLEAKAKTDEVQAFMGLLFIWPALLFLEGGDGPDAEEYSNLTGERRAIEHTLIAKSCPISPDMIPTYPVEKEEKKLRPISPGF